MRHENRGPAVGKPSRREFVRTAAAVSAAGVVAVAQPQRIVADDLATNNGAQGRLIKPGDVVLFQGDSITDAGRKRDAEIAAEANHQPAMGEGYAWLVAATLLLDRPEDRLRFYNRGISGNKVHQLDERWELDCIELRPNVVSILIGVNDIWHTLNGKFDSTVEKYGAGYQALVERTRQELPDAKLVICEPFVTRCGAVNDKWFPDFDGYRGAARRVADQAGATFVPLQSMFDAASRLAPPEHWAYDGVHPTWAGAAMMAHAWLKAVGE